MWELTPHNDSIDFEVFVKRIGASKDHVVWPCRTCVALDGKVHGSLRCDSGGRWVHVPAFSIFFFFLGGGVGFVCILCY